MGDKRWVLFFVSMRGHVFLLLGLEMRGTAQRMKTGKSLEWGRSMEIHRETGLIFPLVVTR